MLIGNPSDRRRPAISVRRLHALLGDLPPGALVTVNGAGNLSIETADDWIGYIDLVRESFENGETPLYDHDCPRCVFLATERGHDLYFCAQSGLPTVIARFGHSADDYLSGLALAEVDPILAVAKEYAARRGFV